MHMILRALLMSFPTSHAVKTQPGAANQDVQE